MGKRTFNTFTNPRDKSLSNGDLESGRQGRPKKFNGLKDAVEYAIDRQTTADLKKKLRSGITRGEFEKARRSDDEVCETYTKPHQAMPWITDRNLIAEKHQEQKTPPILRKAECSTE